MNTNIYRTTAPPPNRLDPVQRLSIGLAIVSAVAVAIGSVGPCVHWEDYSEEVPRTWTDYGLISSGSSPSCLPSARSSPSYWRPWAGTIPAWHGSHSDCSRSVPSPGSSSGSRS